MSDDNNAMDLQCSKRAAVFCLLICAVLPTLPLSALAGPFEPDPPWPLCGRISENPPPGWRESDGCPPERFGNPDYSDEPLSSTFGPRPLYSGNNRYDFHRGLDIAAPVGTPFFAITDGLVQIAGEHPSYSDSLVAVRHLRPGAGDCEPRGCYTALYLHAGGWAVQAGEQVVKGQLLGYTGVSGSGFEHLHFEIRDAPSFDPYSAWSRDAIHPLRVLAYRSTAQAEITFQDVSWPSSLEMTLTNAPYDLLSVDIEALDHKLHPIPQPGDRPDAHGYHVYPPFFDMELANFEYSHKDSSALPWAAFGEGGPLECPYHEAHGASYSPHVHLDAQDPGDYRRGLFNGIGVRTLRYWPSDEGGYKVGLEYHELPAEAACLEVTATFHSGPPAFASTGNCIDGAARRLVLRVAGSRSKVRLSWTGLETRKVEVYRNGAPWAGPVAGKSWTDTGVIAGGRYRYRVCPVGRPDRCSHSQIILLSR